MKTFNVIEDAIEYSKQNPSKLTEYKWFNNKNLKKHCFYLNGKQHGECKWFYEDGIINDHCFYKNGIQHGKSKWFYNDGTLHEQCFYINGDLHGEYKTFHSDGSIKKHCFVINYKEQPQLDYLITERDEMTLTLLFGDCYL